MLKVDCNTQEQDLRGQMGFSLIELAIVLVIVRLLIAGIAAGKSLLDQARLRSVISEAVSYNSAYRNFKDRYHTVPGDMKNAYEFWGAKCTSGTMADCDGNGNSIIEYANNSSNEVNKAWKHLSLAGMLGFEMGGDPASNGGGDITIGQQVPYSKIQGAGYVFQGPLNSNTSMFGAGNNGLLLGSGGGSGSSLNSGALTPQEAFTIDQKVDDGAYDASGNAIGGTTGNTRAFDPSASTNSCIDVSSGYYNLSNNQRSCMVGFASDAQVQPMQYFGTVATTGLSSFSGVTTTTAPLPFTLPANFISDLYNAGYGFYGVSNASLGIDIAGGGASFCLISTGCIGGGQRMTTSLQDTYFSASPSILNPYDVSTNGKSAPTVYFFKGDATATNPSAIAVSGGTIKSESTTVNSPIGPMQQVTYWAIVDNKGNPIVCRNGIPPCQ